MRRHTNRPSERKNDASVRINSEITAREVRVIGENIDNPGIYPITVALNMAEAQNMDLVEISPNANPPVCRIVDFQKYQYQQKKRMKELKDKSIKTELKEIRFGPNTDEHDYLFKLKHARNFLEAGDKVKAFVFFKGRSILFSQQGEILLLRLANDLEDVGKVEFMPKLEGKRMTIIIVPKSKKK
ncbi:MAG: translation initiation factor IF-3 [Prevotellaceae bacterium]|jgi:translation initiation factor IF-3|nr:translation initiation factor IF-3 [Prevotellaceae bacterium]